MPRRVASDLRQPSPLQLSLPLPLYASFRVRRVQQLSSHAARFSCAAASHAALLLLPPQLLPSSLLLEIINNTL